MTPADQNTSAQERTSHVRGHTSRFSKDCHHAIRRIGCVCLCCSVQRPGSCRTNIRVQRAPWCGSNRGKRRFGVTVQGHAAVTEHIVSGDDASAVRHLDGTGSATHLGRFTLSANFTVITATGNATGTATWTAANGDQIRVTVVGHGDIVVFPTVTITETHTITGGNGRFADASGTLTIDRSANIVTGVSSGSLSGTINLGH